METIGRSYSELALPAVWLGYTLEYFVYVGQELEPRFRASAGLGF